MPAYIIDNYDSFTFNLYQLMQANTDEEVIVVRNDKISFDELKARRPSRIVLSPGPGHPAEDKDFGICKEVVKRQEELGCPVLGVCLGHQGMAQHLGGAVVRAPQIVHGKTSIVEIIAPSPILAGLDSTFNAMRYHSLVVEESKLPACLEVTAREKQHGLIMSMQHKTLPLFGVQFHPESIGTPAGKVIMQNFLALNSAQHQSERRRA
jgi:anthranilate synthase component II